MDCNSSKKIIKRTFIEVTPSTDTSNLPDNTQIVYGCGCWLKSKSTVVGGGNTCPANNWDKTELYYMCIPTLQSLNHNINVDRLYSLINQFGADVSQS